MPTYEYSCDTCGERFDWVQSFSEDALKRCPGKRGGGPATEACTSPGKGKVKKVFSAVGISFKGDGFYKNDHGSSSKPKDSGDSKSSSDSSSSSSSDASKEKATTSSDKKSDSKPSSSKSDSKSPSGSSSSSKKD